MHQSLVKNLFLVIENNFNKKQDNLAGKKTLKRLITFIQMESAQFQGKEIESEEYRVLSFRSSCDCRSNIIRNCQIYSIRSRIG